MAASTPKPHDGTQDDTQRSSHTPNRLESSTEREDVATKQAPQQEAITVTAPAQAPAPFIAPPLTLGTLGTLGSFHPSIPQSRQRAQEDPVCIYGSSSRALEPPMSYQSPYPPSIMPRSAGLQQLNHGPREGRQLTYGTGLRPLDQPMRHQASHALAAPRSSDLQQPQEVTQGEVHIISGADIKPSERCLKYDARLEARREYDVEADVPGLEGSEEDFALKSRNRTLELQIAEGEKRKKRRSKMVDDYIRTFTAAPTHLRAIATADESTTCKSNTDERLGVTGQLYLNLSALTALDEVKATYFLAALKCNYNVIKLGDDPAGKQPALVTDLRALICTAKSLM